MVENLQVIESLFQHEKVETGQVENLSKKALVDRGRMTAMAALKELRSIIVVGGLISSSEAEMGVLVA
ncbi:ypt/Rab-GAP domain of gyp1p superfamily protein [Artemisia annua]|uniref:Ypt/Rab-GAP domain of gyp1p superfamily protein n=1 Tax=Artemisia annua TaxID=35608 RepID=A0A2U1NCA3_ARTAN|nr:ypt/Rab-GAP domain of gyp1p superfamily protein [Artemisia annua]